MTRKKGKKIQPWAVINALADGAKAALVSIAALAGGVPPDQVTLVAFAAAGVTALRRLDDEFKDRDVAERVKALEQAGALGPAKIDAQFQKAGLEIAELRDALTRLLVQVAEVAATHADRIDELASRLEEHIKSDPPKHLSDVPHLFVEAATVWIKADTAKIRARTVEVEADKILLRQPSHGASRWNVPIPQNPHFVGRDEDMKRLYEAIEGTREKGEVVNVVGVMGIGGIGKSQLAAEYAHMYRDHYPAGVYWVDAGSEDLTSEFYKLGPFMGVGLPEQPTTEAIQAVVIKVMNYLGGREASLLILDNITEPKILQGWTLDGPGWLPTGVQCRVLATSRRTDLPNTTSLDIDTLDPEDALDLLTAKRKPEGAKEKKATERICRQVDYLPLALEITSAYLARYASVTFDGYSRCIEAEGALDPLDMAAEDWVSHVQGQKPVRAVLKEMASKVEGDALKLLLAVGCAAPVSMHPSMLATVADLDMEARPGRPSPFEVAANALIESSLLKRDPETARFTSHALVHEFARNELGTRHLRLQAGASFCELLGSALNDEATITMLPRVVLEEPHCVSAYHLAVKIARLDWAGRIANGLGLFYKEVASYRPALTWLRRSLAAARRAGAAPDVVATGLNNMGTVLQDQGEHKRALRMIRRALQLDQRTLGAAHPAVARDLSNLGTVLEEQGDYAAALQAQQRARDIYLNAYGALHPSVAVCLNNIGSVLHDLADYNGALDAYRRALAVDREALGKDHPLVAVRINNIGTVLREQGDHQSALDHFSEALGIAQRAFGPLHPHAATPLGNIASVLRHQGRYDDARRVYARVLQIDQQALGWGHPAVAMDVNNIGTVLLAKGDLDGALKAFRRALHIHRKALGADHHVCAIFLANCGFVLHEKGDHDGALTALRRALRLDEETAGCLHPSVATCLGNIGLALQAKGESVRALHAYRRALRILRTAFGTDHPELGKILNNVGTLLAEAGKLQKGAQYVSRGLRILRAKLGPAHPETRLVAQSLRNMGLDPEEECQE